jgi:hypothetical protein
MFPGVWTGVAALRWVGRWGAAEARLGGGRVGTGEKRERL